MRTLLHDRFPRSRSAPARVRSAVAGALSGRFPAMTSAVLVASELVTNALRHGEGSITVSLFEGDHGVMLEVADAGDGFTTGDVASSDGFGLEIVDRLARRWGFERRSGHSVVWVELAASA